MIYFLPLSKIDHEQQNLVGAKAYSLSLLSQKQLPICEGYVITKSVQNAFFHENDLLKKLRQQLKLFDLADPQSLLSATKRIQSLILNSQLPKPLVQDLFELYDELHENGKTLTLRTSLIKEVNQTPHPLYLAITGEHTLIEMVKQLYADLITPAFLASNQLKIIPETAIIIQKTFNSKNSGLLHTTDPYTHNKHHFVIEAIWGISKNLLTNNSFKDKYSVDKRTLETQMQKTNPQQTQWLLSESLIKEAKVPVSKQISPKLNAKQIYTLAKYAPKVANINPIPQTVEWGFDGTDFVFFQTQELIESEPLQNSISVPVIKNHQILVEGVAHNPGLGSGFLADIDDDQPNYNAEIVTVSEFHPKHKSLLIKANGIITFDKDNLKELKLFAQDHGIPLVLLHKNSRRFLTLGQFITIDGSTGMVYKGSLLDQQNSAFTEREVTIQP